ncbi:MAG TPA: CHASE2 domain-containing protein, partial [Kiloniellaceae bacterium]|nr:CHASE2 domain-containing protein [Kiloniellaceae bacterium]
MRYRLLYWLFALAVTLVVALLYLGAAEWPFFAKLEGQSLTWRFQLRGPVEPGPETLLVAIDDASLAGLGRWPLPRHVLAEAVDKLHAAGAKVLVLDLLLMGEEAAPPGTTDLAETVAAIDRLLLPYAFDYGKGGSILNDRPAAALPEAVVRTAFPLVRINSDAERGSAPQPTGVLLPAGNLLTVARLAQANVFLAADGELHHGFPALLYGDAYYPSLAVEAVRLYRGLEPEEILLDLGHGLEIGDTVIPLDRQSRLAVNHYGPLEAFDRVSLL